MGYVSIWRSLPSVSLLGAAVLLGSVPVQAQIVPDATLPTRSIATPGDTTITITGGTQSGSHLFHSFDTFSIGPGQTAIFDHGLDLDTLITRVTGSSISTIEGILETQGRADFFLLNPNGIVFSETAQLNVGGSFIASTADRLVFDNGKFFSATHPQAPPLLIVNTPAGLQYGRQPSEIQVNGGGHTFAINPITLDVITTDRPLGLQVNNGETLALLGGAVTIDGGNLTAPEGRISLNGVAEGGEIRLTPDALGWIAEVGSFDVDSSGGNNGVALEAIALTNAASLVTSGDGGGEVRIQGQFIDVLEGATVLATTEAGGTGQGIHLQATDEIILAGSQLDETSGEVNFTTSLLAEVALDAAGDGGPISLAAPFILLEEGAQVSTSVFGSGDGGDIQVNAETIAIVGGTANVLAGTEDFFPSEIALDVVDDRATGRGGQLTLQANQLTVAGGGSISASTFGPGAAGRLNILVDDVLVTGGSAELGGSLISAQTDGPGKGGRIRIEGDRLQVLGGAEVAVDVFGSGNGGRIDIVTDTIMLEGTSPGGTVASSLASTVQAEDGTGQGGDIRIQTTELTVVDGAEITSETLSQSTENRAGNITIDAESIRIRDENNVTGIFASVNRDLDGNIGQNAGGRITLRTETLTLENGAQIVVGTRGPGNAGRLKITANTITLDGRNNQVRSGLFASALAGTGEGGDIIITTDALTLQNGATVNASNVPSTNANVPPGRGAAGNILINAPTLQLDNQGIITTSTNVGDRGNIILNSDLITLSDRASITTDARADATGGNIVINTDFLIANPNDNSDITANAIRGRGGNIDITAQRIFGLEFRDELTPQSDITVSSEFGVDGEVIIDLLAVDSTSDLGKLPSGVVDESDRVATGCPADQGANFIATGRGGLPDSLSQQIQSPLILHAFERGLDDSAYRPDSSLNPSLDPRVLEDSWDLSPQQTRSQPRAIAEAQGWSTTNGTIELTAHSAGVRDVAGDVPSAPSLNAIACLRRAN